MKTWKALVASVGLHLALTTGQAPAQGRPVYPLPRPSVSPYLNLLRRDAPPAINYYNLVRPQIEFRNAIDLLQSQTTANRQAITELGAADALPPTGRRVGFQTHGKYFQNLGSGGAAGARPVTTQSGARPQTSSRAPTRR